MWNNAAPSNGKFGPFRNSPVQLAQTGIVNTNPLPLSTPTDTSGGVLPTPPSAMEVGPGAAPGAAPPPSTGGYFAPPGSYSAGNGAQADNSSSGTPPALAMADGGMIPSQGGTVNPDLSSALAVAQQALQGGRAQFGLPQQLIGGNQPSSADMSDEDDETDEQQNLQNGKGMLEMKMVPGTTERTVGKNVQTPGYTPGYGNASYAGGGPVEGDMDNPADTGIPDQPQDNAPAPQQGQTQAINGPGTSSGNLGGENPLQMYAMGAGAVPPDVAQALEQRVDPQGTMDPSQRKLLAVASAPPQAQFGLMQHYRQRFNALSAFARAAATGSPARPASLTASTDAATRAFHNVPNGHSISFAPAGPGHVAVTIATYAGGAGASGKVKKQRGFAAGGPVPDDVVSDSDESGPQDTSGVLPDLSSMESAAQSGAEGAQDVEANVDQTMTEPVEGGGMPGPLDAVRAAGRGYRAMEKAATDIHQSVMTVPQYITALKNGIYDAFMDTPPADALNKAANQSWASSITAPGTENGNATDTSQTPAQNLTPQEPKPGMYIGANALPGSQPSNPIATSQTPVRMGADSINPEDVEHDIERARYEGRPNLAPRKTDIGPDGLIVRQGGAPTALAYGPNAGQGPNYQSGSSGMIDMGNGFSAMEPTAQGVQGMRAKLAGDNAGRGSRPAQVSLPGFDPRVIAQASALYPQGTQAWKDFAIRAQTGLLGAAQQQALANIKGKYQVQAIQGREGRIDQRAAAGRAASQQRTNTIAGQRGGSSRAATINSMARAIIASSPGTDYGTAYAQAIKAYDGLPSTGGQPQEGGQPEQNGIQQAPAEATLRIVGQTYMTPKGPAKWMGQGWLPVAGQ